MRLWYKHRSMGASTMVRQSLERWDSNMIKNTDQPSRSVQAVYIMWKAKIKPATFPVIPGEMLLAEVYKHINQWLFDTGYLNPQYYKATYETCEGVSEDKARAMLGEIFCN